MSAPAAVSLRRHRLARELRRRKAQRRRGGTPAAAPGTATAARAGFWIGAATDRPPTTGAHVAFSAGSAEQVDAFHRAALDAGGREFLPPGVQLRYSDRYYGAFVWDLDGNNVEAVFHPPVPLGS